MDVWWIMSAKCAAASSCMHHPPLTKDSRPSFTSSRTLDRSAAPCSFHHLEKKAISAYTNVRAGSFDSSSTTLEMILRTSACWMDALEPVKY